MNNNNNRILMGKHNNSKQRKKLEASCILTKVITLNQLEI